MEFSKLWWIVVSLLMVLVPFCDCISCWYGHADHKDLLTMNEENVVCQIEIQLKYSAETDGKCRLQEDSTYRGIYFGFAYPVQNPKPYYSTEHPNQPLPVLYTETPNDKFQDVEHKGLKGKNGKIVFLCRDDGCNTEDLVKYYVWKTLTIKATDGNAGCLKEALSIQDEENIECFEGNHKQSKLKSVSRKRAACHIKFTWNAKDEALVMDGIEVQLEMSSSAESMHSHPEYCAVLNDEIICYCRTTKCNNQFNLKNLLNKKKTRVLITELNNPKVIEAALNAFSNLNEPQSATQIATVRNTPTSVSPVPSVGVEEERTPIQTSKLQSSNNQTSSKDDEKCPKCEECSCEENSKKKLIVYALIPLTIIVLIFTGIAMWHFWTEFKENDAKMISSNTANVPNKKKK